MGSFVSVFVNLRKKGPSAGQSLQTLVVVVGARCVHSWSHFFGTSGRQCCPGHSIPPSTCATSWSGCSASHHSFRSPTALTTVRRTISGFPSTRSLEFSEEIAKKVQLREGSLCLSPCQAFTWPSPAGRLPGRL